MVIINVNIKSMANNDFANGYVRTNGGVFTEIGDMKDYKPTDEEVIDGEGADLYPGFIDAHCHLGMWSDALCFEGDDRRGR